MGWTAVAFERRVGRLGVGAGELNETSMTT